MSVSNSTFCTGCVSDPCEGLCKVPSPEYCDGCGGECDGCCNKVMLKPRPKDAEFNEKDKLENDLKHILTNSDTYVKMFLIRLHEELQRRSSSNSRNK